MKIRLAKLHHEVGDDNVEIESKESRKTNAVRGDWMVVQRKERSKRVSCGLGNYLPNNVPRDPGNSKI